MTQQDFAWAMTWWVHHFDARVSNWLRSRWHNEHVGGVPHSAHLVGLAADVVYRELPARGEREDWASRLGLRLIVEDDHDHLQPVEWRAG